MLLYLTCLLQRGVMVMDLSKTKPNARSATSDQTLQDNKGSNSDIFKLTSYN